MANPHSALRSWISNNRGFVHPDIEVAFTPEQGHHVRVADGKAIAAGTGVAKCSMYTAMSVLNALHTPPFSCRGTKLPDPFIQDADLVAIQTFFLMEQWLLGERSWWAPYLRTLPGPKAIAKVFLCDESDIALLKGTNLEKALSEQLLSMRKRFTAGNARLQQLGWERAVQGGYTWSLFVWAFTIFASRSFTSDVLDNTLPSDKGSRLGRGDPEHGILSRFFEESFPVLLPLLDLLNYRPGAKVEWQSGTQDVGLRVLDSLESGKEVCNNYGPKDNGSLFLGYGFTIPNNAFDYYAVGFKVPAGSPLAEARQLLDDGLAAQKLYHREESSYRYHILNADHPHASSEWLELSLFSTDLFDSMAVLSGNPRELDNLSVVKKRITFDLEASHFGKPRRQRNILHTLFQLHIECTNRLEPLERVPTEAPPVTGKEINAYIYRNGQITILRTAALLCRYCLLMAASRNPESVLQDAAAAEGLEGTSQPVRHLQSLLTRKEAATTCQILFTAQQIIDYLPESLGQTIQKAVEACASAAKEYSGSLLPSDILEKTRFAIILGALRNVRTTRSVRLPRRFRAWMRDLQRWYGWEDEYWNMAVEEFVPVLNALMADKDDTPVWADPRYLCWGWNVQHEEGLFSTVERALEPAVALRPVGYQLCIPLKRKSRESENGVEVEMK